MVKSHPPPPATAAAVGDSRAVLLASEAPRGLCTFRFVTNATAASDLMPRLGVCVSVCVGWGQEGGGG